MSDFQPDWVSPPGETIEELLDKRDWTQIELAKRMGVTKKHVNDLIRGRASLSKDTAMSLHLTLGSTVDFWLAREAQYQAAVVRHERVAKLAAESEWLQDLPVAWMVKQGWIAARTSVGEKVLACLEFFEVASVTAWRAQHLVASVAFRAGQDLPKKQGSAAAWLREAERQAHRMDTRPFSKQTLKDSLPALCVQPDPVLFVPELRKICAQAGVGVVFLPHPPGCPVFGATKWLGRDKAMLVLSLRYRSDDQLWFSFFHEVGHLLLHGKELFVEGDERDRSEREDEANAFASELLIPPRVVSSLAGIRSEADVLRFAQAISVSPGVIVGRLQHDGLVPHSHLTGLKARYEWGQPRAWDDARRSQTGHGAANHRAVLVPLPGTWAGMT